jgi:hypothetical protein
VPTNEISRPHGSGPHSGDFRPRHRSEAIEVDQDVDGIGVHSLRRLGVAYCREIDEAIGGCLSAELHLAGTLQANKARDL